MLIQEHSIQAVFDSIDIVKVISQFVELKKAGSNYKGLSPFATEKTPSFMVSPGKQIFKCFSSGKGGGAVTFLMEHKNLTYPEAIKYIAEQNNIVLQYQEDTRTPEQVKTALDKKTDAENILRWATGVYGKQLAQSKEATAYLTNRGFTPEDILQWNIGYAPEYSKLVREPLLEKGKLQLGEELFLVGKKGDKLNNRIVFPIQDQNERIVGLAGRQLTENKDFPKYINPSDHVLYRKNNILYGLNFAYKPIKELGKAYLVEGYTDVIAMHRHFIENTVAACGTAITEQHVNLLKRYTSTACLMLDGDAAGIKASQRVIPMFLQAGFKLEVCPLPTGQDPENLCETQDDPSQYIEQNTTDALIYFTEKLLEQANNDLHKKQEVFNTLSSWLQYVPHDIVRDGYIDLLSKHFKISKADFKKGIKKQAEITVHATPVASKKKLKLPKGVDENEVLNYGFYGLINGEQTGYWFQTSMENFTNVSNFVLTPLFHKYDIDDNTRIVKIQNDRGMVEIVEMPSKSFISLDQFRNFLFDKGAFFFDGTKQHLDRLAKRYLHDFPKAFELKTLGWQPEGFFAYYNASFNGKLTNYNEIGIVEHEGKHYFSPASSDIYKDYRKDESDQYENDRYLAFEKSPINFEQWAQLMFDVYDMHALSGVMFAVLSLFKDIVFKVDNNAPFLYCYGQSQSGKSKFAESITNLFFNEMPAFNVNSGTDFAFAARLSRFRNCPVFFNEFDDSSCKDEWFQAIKGAYDGEGRERGKGGSKKKTEIQKVNCSLLLVGQYLSTKDDNSVLSRSILRVFKKEENRDESKVTRYNYLKDIEKKGLSSMLTELLVYRNKIENRYYNEFNNLYKQAMAYGRAKNKTFNERVCRNYSALNTLNYIISDWFEFPWTPDQYNGWALEEIEKVSGMISQNDILTEFWTTVETLFNDYQLKEGVHYKLVNKQVIRLTDSDRKDFEKDLTTSKPVLYLRLRNVHQVYQKFKRSATGSSGMDLTSLTTYLKQREYFIGAVNSESFQVGKTSAFVFDYNQLDISLEFSDPNKEAIENQLNTTPT